jgi:spore coat protein CotH
LSAAVAGCDRRSDASASSGNAQVESRQTKLPVQNIASPERPTNQASVPPAATHVSKLPIYELKMDSNDLRTLEGDPGSNETHPATFIADGEVYTNARVRFRGEWARSWPKKPFKIFFSRDQPFQGHHSLNLNSAWRDPAFVRETLAYHVYAACGVPASRSRMVDKTLLSRFHLKGAALFKATSDDNQADERDLGSEASFAPHYENETSKTNGLRDLQLFCHQLAVATNTLDFFTRHLDLEEYINYLAATVLIQHWDGYNKNHFLVHDRRGSGKWFVLPWDLDRTFGDHWNNSFGRANLSILLGTRQAPGVTGWNRLQDRFLSDPALRARFLDRLAELLEKEFTTDKLFPILDQLESDIGPEAALDRRRWRGPAGNLHNGVAGLKSFIERRRTWLQGELAQLRQAGPLP